MKENANLFGRLVPRNGTMIFLDAWVRRGAQHPQRTRWFAMMDFGEPIKEKGCTTKEGNFGKTRRERKLCDSKADNGMQLPQGAKSLHLGGLVLP
jgi:hypothetical protein